MPSVQRELLLTGLSTVYTAGVAFDSESVWLVMCERVER